MPTVWTRFGGIDGWVFISFLTLFTIYLPNHNLNYTDKMSMAVGVEAREPLLDMELANTVTRYPYAWLGNQQPQIEERLNEQSERSRPQILEPSRLRRGTLSCGYRPGGLNGTSENAL